MGAACCGGRFGTEPGNGSPYFSVPCGNLVCALNGLCGYAHLRFNCSGVGKSLTVQVRQAWAGRPIGSDVQTRGGGPEYSLLHEAYP